jgi:2,4'-dihydroxyacetophenone dioxygenase
MSITTSSAMSSLPSVQTQVFTDAPDNMTQYDRDENAFVDKYGVGDIFIGRDDVPWVPFTDTIDVRVMRLDKTTGDFALGLRASADSVVGKHRHRSGVIAITYSGSWGYVEYDWEAKAGDFIRESPGTIHTLWVKAGTEILYIVDGGGIEYFHPDNTYDFAMDGFSFLRRQHEYCAEQGIDINEAVFF